MDKFERDILNKIDEGQSLTERELKTLIWEYEVERDEYEQRRWTMGVCSIVCLNDRYFSICWEEGLTEMQEDEYEYQPEEVKPIEYKQMRVIREYIGVNADEEMYIKKHNGERI